MSESRLYLESTLIGEREDNISQLLRILDGVAVEKVKLLTERDCSCLLSSKIHFQKHSEELASHVHQLESEVNGMNNEMTKQNLLTILQSMEIICENDNAIDSIVERCSATLEDETNFFESQMDIEISDDNKSSEENIKSALNRLSLTQLQQRESITSAMREVRSKSTSQSTDINISFSSSRRNAAVDPVSKAPEKQYPSLSLSPIAKKHEVKPNAGFTQLSHRCESFIGTENEHLLADQRHRALEVESIFDHYLTELHQLCSDSRRTLAPLLAKTARELHGPAMNE